MRGAANEREHSMAKVALLTLHGMGEAREDYSDDLIAGLTKRLQARIKDVVVRSVHYRKPLQANENAVWRRVKAHNGVHYDDLRKFLLFGFADAAGLESRKEIPGSAYEDAQIEIARAMLKACDVLGGDGPVVVISQSLGCQVFSCYLYDAWKHAKGETPGIWADIDRFGKAIAGRDLTSREKSFLAGATVRRWITTGCNIPIFVAAHKQMKVKPIEAPTQDFRWLNLYDPDDVLGWPLQPLSEGYRTLVEDRAINSGRGAVDWILKSWNPMSHTAYWRDEQVLGPLEAMLREFL